MLSTKWRFERRRTGSVLGGAGGWTALSTQSAHSDTDPFCSGKLAEFRDVPHGVYGKNNRRQREHENQSHYDPGPAVTEIECVTDAVALRNEKRRVVPVDVKNAASPELVACACTRAREEGYKRHRHQRKDCDDQNPQHRVCERVPEWTSHRVLPS